MTTLDPALLANAGLDAEVIAALTLAIDASVSTGRASCVTLKLPCKLDKESGKWKVKGRVSLSLPQNDDDSLTKKYPAVTVLTLETDHPGQQRIDA